MAFAQYLIIDDYTATSSYGSGAGSGEVLQNFAAGSLADAQTVAAQFAQLFSRTVRLAPIGGAAPYTSYAPNTACRVLPSAIPPSITF